MKKTTARIAHFTQIKRDICSEQLMAKDDGTLSWGVKRRLEFVEFRLFWEEHVNRGDLIERFRISVN
jgi:hypothetical protein